MAYTNPTVIVTGASRGIGLSATKILLDKPFEANVIALSRSSPPELESLAQRYPGSLIISKGDVSKDGDNKEAVELATRTFGRLDALILNAGTLDPVSKISSMEIGSLRNLFEVNVISLFSIVKHAIPHLRETKGKVVFTSSGAATGNTAAWSAYNASKAALNSLARTLATEEPDITSVALRPGVVDTEMQASIRSRGKEHMSPADYEKFSSLHTSSKLISPDVPGHVLATLAMKAGKELSGGFFSWDDEVMKEYRKAQ